MKKIISLFMITAILVTLFSGVVVFAEEETVLVDGVYFSKDKKTLIKYTSIGRRESYVIPDTVTTIADSAFEKAIFLKTITIPESVTKIEKHAFAFCSSLTEITLPESVTKIEDYTFDRCTGLVNVVILGDVTTIGVRAFNECTSLKSITIPASLKTVKDGAFDVCSVLSDVNYLGTEEMWLNIEFESNNQFITTVSIRKQKNEHPVIKLNGKEIAGDAIDQPPIIENGRTLVPLRAIFEALGATVTWDGDTRTVGATRNKTVISLQIDSTEMKVGDEIKILDVPAKIVNSRTLVPVRAVAEAFGCEVMWDAVTNTVIIED